jgi:Flp pilus assembly protein protease CpaA
MFYMLRFISPDTLQNIVLCKFYDFFLIGDVDTCTCSNWFIASLTLSYIRLKGTQSAQIHRDIQMLTLSILWVTP